MGITSSTTGKPTYSDADVKRNIDELFNNARTYNFSEASYSIKDLDNIVVSDLPQQNGGIRFNSSKKRYLRHNINDLVHQQGGNNSYEEISDMSEFQKIKDFLINDMKNNQAGGDYDIDDLDNIVSSATMTANSNSNTQLIKFLNALKGGNVEDIDDDEDAESDLDEIVDDNEEEEDLEGIDEDEADEDLDGLDEEDNDSDEKPKKKKNSKKIDKEENLDEDDSETKSDGSDLSITSEDGIIRNPEEYSATSYIEKSSELNILPFYSSDSSINKKPYMKKRIH